jgi:hypothetical protein
VEEGRAAGIKDVTACYGEFMEMVETALGRYVPIDETQTYLEDAILGLLYRYRMHPQNPNNAPMKLSDIVRAVLSEESQVVAALDALKENPPPFVEEGARIQNERTFRITGSGVRFVRNMPQGMDSIP